jgi:hypothetical protein
MDISFDPVLPDQMIDVDAITAIAGFIPWSGHDAGSVAERNHCVNHSDPAISRARVVSETATDRDGIDGTYTPLSPSSVEQMPT